MGLLKKKRNIHAVLHGVMNKCSLIHNNRRIINNNEHFFGRLRRHSQTRLYYNLGNWDSNVTQTNQPLSRPWETGCDSITNEGYYMYMYGAEKCTGRLYPPGNIPDIHFC
jgi:hypothetical protein